MLLPHQATADWDDLPRHEKIKRVPVQPLPLNAGQLMHSAAKSSKRFAVRVVQQKPGVFELDEDNVIVIYVTARGRRAALDFVSHTLSGRPCWPYDSKPVKAKCGRWYDGTLVEMEIQAVEKFGTTDVRQPS